MYALNANTSSETGVGSWPEALPVAFSLLRKQSTTRSAREINREARALYSGKTPATPTIGRPRSRCPAFK
jgi:hypothetical protein